ncbi:hypothetical protein C8Q80DRAFT_1121744 [Daedaleopsis nitida]|nr:hypothetical protein C8Q80DRAFT_1121744 [Daedaleopsis nitida]
MSSDNEFADLVAIYAVFATEDFVDFAAISAYQRVSYSYIHYLTRRTFLSAFFTYDFATTFDREVRYFWRRKFSIASAVFLSIRYCYLLNGLVNLLVVVLRSDEGCKATEFMDAILKYSLYIPFAVFSGTRAYALCRNRLLAGFIAVLSLAPVCVNWTSFAIDETALFDPMFGCIVVTSVTQRDNIINISSHLMSRYRRENHTHTLCQAEWFRILEYTAVERTLFILNTLHLAFTMTSILSNGFDTTAPSQLTRFTDPLTAILIYRFILDLQEANDHHVKAGSQLSLGSETQLSFVDRAIGSLGAAIVPGIAAVEDEYEDTQAFKAMWRHRRAQGVPLARWLTDRVPSDGSRFTGLEVVPGSPFLPQ